MDSATIQAVSASENPPDTREIPLEVLAADDDVHRRVTAIVDSAQEQPHVAVAKFGSAII